MNNHKLAYFGGGGGLCLRVSVPVVGILIRNDSARILKELRLPWLSSLASQNGATGGITAQSSRARSCSCRAHVGNPVGSSIDHGLGLDPGPSSTVAVFVTIMNDMSVDERSLAYAHGGVFFVNARSEYFAENIMTLGVCSEWSVC